MFLNVNGNIMDFFDVSVRFPLVTSEIELDHQH